MISETRNKPSHKLELLKLLKVSELQITSPSPKDTKPATMNIFRKKNPFFLNHCKSRIKLSFHNKSVHYS